MENQREATNIVEIKNPSSLKMRFDCGEDDNGKTITKSRSYSHVKASAKGVDVYNVAKALESLQKNTLIEIVKQDNTSLNP